jgi:hypothetical protein
LRWTSSHIPVRGGDFIERDGRRYAVLFDADRVLVAAYEIVGERLRAAALAANALFADPAQVDKLELSPRVKTSVKNRGS